MRRMLFLLPICCLSIFAFGQRDTLIIHEKGDFKILENQFFDKNDDLVKQSSIVNDYSHKILKDTTIDGYECYMIELIPKESAAVVWGKILSCISKKDYFQLLVKFFDEDDYLVNTMYASQIKMFGGRLIPSYLEMTSADNAKQKTVFIYSHLEFDLKIEDSFFSLQNMKNLR